ncbi:oxidoreductase [Halomonas shantousis]
MNQELKVGLVGYGFAGKTFHAPLLAAQRGLSLVAVSSRDAAKVHADWPQVEVEASPEALFARDDLDMVVIPTPNDTHYPLVRAALDAGKHVVVDKPFTVTLEEARALKTHAESCGKVLSVFHNRRWDSDFLTVRNLVDGGALGRLVHVESHFDRYKPEVRDRWRESPAPGGGLWYDLGPHLIDQALVLFGMPQNIWLDLAMQRDGAQVDDYFHAVLCYDRLRVVLHAGSLVAVPAPRFTLHGTRGSYLKHGLDPQEDRLKRGELPAPQWGEDTRHGTFTLGPGYDGNDLPETSEIPTLPGDYLAYYAGVRDAILGRQPNPVPIDEAVAVMAVIEAGLESARQARWVPLGERQDNA